MQEHFVINDGKTWLSFMAVQRHLRSHEVRLSNAALLMQLRLSNVSFKELTNEQWKKVRLWNLCPLKHDGDLDEYIETVEEKQERPLIPLACTVADVADGVVIILNNPIKRGSRQNDALSRNFFRECEDEILAKQTLRTFFRRGVSRSEIMFVPLLEDVGGATLERPLRQYEAMIQSMRSVPVWKRTDGTINNVVRSAIFIMKLYTYGGETKITEIVRHLRACGDSGATVTSVGRAIDKLGYKSKRLRRNAKLETYVFATKIS